MTTLNKRQACSSLGIIGFAIWIIVCAYAVYDESSYSYHDFSTLIPLTIYGILVALIYFWYFARLSKPKLIKPDNNSNNQDTSNNNTSQNDGALGSIYFWIGLLVLSVIYGVFAELDKAGWISHTKETTITAQSNWIVGENKTCISFPAEPQIAKSLKIENYDVTHKVICDQGEDHNINVTFYGRTERQEKSVQSRGVRWKCIKKTDSFVCYDLD